MFNCIFESRSDWMDFVIYAVKTQHTDSTLKQYRMINQFLNNVETIIYVQCVCLCHFLQSPQFEMATS